MISKTCKDCGAVKPLDEFYAHPRMGDGYLNKCKACVKARVKFHRAANLEKVREYDRQRSWIDKRVDTRRRVALERRADPDKRARDREMSRLWVARNNVKRRAHIMVGNALKYGHLIRPDACERCGKAGHVDGHHEDYYKPLDVTWLCEPCHGVRHREINAERRMARAS